MERLQPLTLSERLMLASVHGAASMTESRGYARVLAGGTDHTASHVLASMDTEVMQSLAEKLLSSNRLYIIFQLDVKWL